MKSATSNRKQQFVKLKVVKPGTKSGVSVAARELSTQIERVKAYAESNRGTFATQVESAKRALPSRVPIVMTGPQKRHATR